MRKNQGDARSDRLLPLILHNRRRVIWIGANRDMAQPFMLTVWPTIQQKNNFVVFNLNVRYDASVARLCRCPFFIDLIHIVSAAWLHIAICMENQPLAGQWQRPHSKSLLRGEETDQFLPAARGQPLC